MKPHIYKIAIILAALTISTVGIRAQSATKATVPFNFVVNNTTIPAGDCLITRAGENAIIISSLAKKGDRAIVLARQGGESDNSLQSKWTFHRYGTSYFFAGMSTSGYALAVPQSKTERSLRKELRLASVSKDHPSSLIPEVLSINVTN